MPTAAHPRPEPCAYWACFVLGCHSARHPALDPPQPAASEGTHATFTPIRAATRLLSCRRASPLPGTAPAGIGTMNRSSVERSASRTAWTRCGGCWRCGAFRDAACAPIGAELCITGRCARRRARLLLARPCARFLFEKNHFCVCVVCRATGCGLVRTAAPCWRPARCTCSTSAPSAGPTRPPSRCPTAAATKATVQVTRRATEATAAAVRGDSRQHNCLSSAPALAARADCCVPPPPRPRALQHMRK